MEKYNGKTRGGYPLMPEIRIRIKPLTICIPDERLAIYERIKTALGRAEAIANDRRIDIKYRLEALRLIAYILSILFLDASASKSGILAGSKIPLRISLALALGTSLSDVGAPMFLIE